MKFSVTTVAVFGALELASCVVILAYAVSTRNWLAAWGWALANVASIGSTVRQVRERI